MRAYERWNTASGYLHPISGRSNLSVITDHLVEKVLVEQSKAKGIVLAGTKGSGMSRIKVKRTCKNA